MPSVLHESVVSFFRARPQLAAELLAPTGLIPPDAEVLPEERSPDLSQPRPPAFHCDHVLMIRTALQRFAVIIEVQLGIDPEKHFTWPVYKAVLRAHLRLPVLLLVVALDDRTAAWAGQPVDLGGGQIFTPVVFGPDRIPAVLDPEVAAASPELAVLSVLAHGEGPLGGTIARNALLASFGLDEAREREYIDLILTSVRPEVRAALESAMQEQWEPRSEFLRRIYAEGKDSGLERGTSQGQRALLLRQLRRRFGDLPERITALVAAADPDQIGEWADAFAEGRSLLDIFGHGH